MRLTLRPTKYIALRLSFNDDWRFLQAKSDQSLNPSNYWPCRRMVPECPGGYHVRHRNRQAVSNHEPSHGLLEVTQVFAVTGTDSCVARIHAGRRGKNTRARRRRILPRMRGGVGAGARFCESCGAPTVFRAARAPGAGADTWISIAMGVILLFLFPHLIQFLVHPGTTAFDATDNQTGAVIPYAHSAFIWPDIGVTFFCLLLIVEPLLMLAPPKRSVALVGAGLGAVVRCSICLS